MPLLQRRAEQHRRGEIMREARNDQPNGKRHGFTSRFGISVSSAAAALADPETDDDE